MVGRPCCFVVNRSYLDGCMISSSLQLSPSVNEMKRGSIANYSTSGCLSKALARYLASGNTTLISRPFLEGGVPSVM